MSCLLRRCRSRHARKENEPVKLSFHRPYIRFLCGVMAGCCSTTIVLPLEVIRVRQMMIKDQYKGFISGAKNVYEYGGILAFYEGLTASLLQMGPQVGISFLVFSYAQPFLLRYLQGCQNVECPPEGVSPDDHHPHNRYSPQNILIASSVAGSIAGFMSKTLTYPFDLTKRRLQIATHKNLDDKYFVPSTSRNLVKCSSLSQCLYKTVEKEGLKGLFRGWSVTVWKSQIASVVAFTSYELMCHVIRDINVASSRS